MSDTTSTEDQTTEDQTTYDRTAEPAAAYAERLPGAGTGGGAEAAETVDDSDTPDTADVRDVGDAVDSAEDAQPAEAGATDEPSGGTSSESTNLGAHSPQDPAAVEKPKGSRVRQLEREGEVAADFLETLLDIADLDGDLDVDVDGDRAAVAIVDSDEGRVPRRLVGQDGKVLEALQELTRLAVQAETGERSRLMLDVAGHRAERRAALVELARAAIEEVKASGEKKALDPMSAFERKVVHDEVAAAGLASESEGADPKRHVVILPA